MRALAALPVALMAAAVAGCGGSGGGSGGGSAGAASTAPCPKGSVVIRMHGIAFDPRTATAKVGQKVCWTNEDGVQHDAVADDGDFKSELFGQGHTFVTTVRRAGPVTYVCTVHPGMQATLRVTP